MPAHFPGGYGKAFFSENLVYTLSQLYNMHTTAESMLYFIQPFRANCASKSAIIVWINSDLFVLLGVLISIFDPSYPGPAC